MLALLFPFASTLLNVALGYAYVCVTALIYRKLTAPGFDPKGKHCVITGGSTGLGLFVALRYAQKGAKVTIIARNQSKLDAAKAEIVKQVPTAKVLIISCDVTDESKVKSSMQAAIDAHGAIDHLVCNAGVAAPGYFLEGSLQAHRKQMEVNYFGCLNAVMAVVPEMVSNKTQGTIVLVSSAVCFAGMVGYSQYAPSKYALRGLSDCLRNEMLRYGIRVVCYFPSSMNTPGFEIEERVKPAETKAIEGSASLIEAQDAADHLISALANGSYSVTNEPLAELGRIATGGVQPREMPFLELVLAPIFMVIGLGFQQFMDYTARTGPGKSSKMD
eukprot:TRINITY_DN14693_c0_g1_i1.p1 TRINITY_DN14693_c0_g1~~TRINITY_DN14693_c0_g1_i1.p1  ORF type:complete len:331 (+),score=83.39 TRINITY_DN14693_c0_g1_i1:22-1014(+)